jgi:hypothetical protein
MLVRSCAGSVVCPSVNYERCRSTGYGDRLTRKIEAHGVTGTISGGIYNLSRLIAIVAVALFQRRLSQCQESPLAFGGPQEVVMQQ